MPTFEGIKTTGNRGYKSDYLNQIYDEISTWGLNDNQVASILSSIVEESGGDPFARNATGTYQGLLQWGPGRYRIKYKDRKKELANQLNYIHSTLNNTKDRVSWTDGGKGSGYRSLRDAYGAFSNSSYDLPDVMRGFSFGYVRPAGKEKSYRNRLKVANQIRNRILREKALQESLLEQQNNNVVVQQPDAVMVAKPMIVTTPKAFTEPMVVAPVPVKYAEGGELHKPKKWDDLSLEEKSEMMKVAVRRGIMSLPEIREAYNEFAEEGYPQSITKEEDDIDDNLFRKGGKVAHDKNYKHVATLYQGYVDRGINPHAALELANQKVAERGWTGWSSGDKKRFSTPDAFMNHTVDFHQRIYPDSIKANNFNQFFNGIENGTNGARYNPNPQVYREHLLKTRPGVKKRINEYRRTQGLEPLAFLGVPTQEDTQDTLFTLPQEEYMLTDEQPTIAAYGGNLYKKGGTMQRANEAVSYFMNKGLTRAQASGLVANLMRESSLSTEALNDDSKAYGLAQWLGDRKDRLFDMYGSHPTFKNQLDYVWHELNTTHRKGLQMLKASKTADEAARNAFGYYEFSAGPEGAVADMNKYNQNGRRSLAMGISNARKLMGQDVGTRFNDVMTGYTADLDDLRDSIDNTAASVYQNNASAGSIQGPRLGLGWTPEPYKPAARPEQQEEDDNIPMPVHRVTPFERLASISNLFDQVGIESPLLQFDYNAPTTEQDRPQSHYAIDGASSYFAEGGPKGRTSKRIYWKDKNHTQLIDDNGNIVTDLGEQDSEGRERFRGIDGTTYHEYNAEDTAGTAPEVIVVPTPLPKYTLPDVPQEKGLEGVYPEFDLLLGGRGFTNVGSKLLGKAYDAISNGVTRVMTNPYAKALMTSMGAADSPYALKDAYYAAQRGDYGDIALNGVRLGLDAADVGYFGKEFAHTAKDYYDLGKAVMDFQRAKPKAFYTPSNAEHTITFNPSATSNASTVNWERARNIVKKEYPLKGEKDIPMDIKKKAFEDYTDFINSQDYLERLQRAGLEDHWDYMKDLTERRLYNIGYFPSRVKTEINGNPDIMGLSSVEPTNKNYGITLRENLPSSDVTSTLTHEIAHWATGNAGKSDMANMIKNPFKYDLNVKYIGDIMRYDENIAPVISWDEILKGLPKSTPFDEVTDMKERYRYLIDAQEKRSRGVSIYKQAKDNNMTIDEFVDRYTKNGKISYDAPKELQDMGMIFTIDNLKKYLKNFLSVSAPISIEATLNANKYGK